MRNIYIYRVKLFINIYLLKLRIIYIYMFYSDMGCQDSVSRGKQPWLENKVLNYGKKKGFLLMAFEEISLEAAIQ